MCDVPSSSSFNQILMRLMRCQVKTPVMYPWNVAWCCDVRCPHFIFIQSNCDGIDEMPSENTFINCPSRTQWPFKVVNVWKPARFVLIGPNEKSDYSTVELWLLTVELWLQYTKWNFAKQRNNLSAHWQLRSLIDVAIQCSTHLIALKKYNDKSDTGARSHGLWQS